MNSLDIIKKWHKLSDTAIVEEVGKMVQEHRLRKNYSQTKLSEMSGVSRATISQLENGRPATLLTFVQVLRALDKFDILESMVQEPEFSPLLYAKMQGKKRKRASKKGSNTYTDNSESSW